MESKIFRHPQELDSVNGIIHDWSFYVKDIIFNENSGVVEIKFKRWAYDKIKLIKKILFVHIWERPFLESILRVNYVEGFDAQNKMEIKSDWLNELIYEQNNGKNFIRINCCASMTITMKVKELFVEVIDTGVVIKKRRSLTFS